MYPAGSRALTLPALPSFAARGRCLRDQTCSHPRPPDTPSAQPRLPFVLRGAGRRRSRAGDGMGCGTPRGGCLLRRCGAPRAGCLPCRVSPSTSWVCNLEYPQAFAHAAGTPLEQDRTLFTHVRARSSRVVAWATLLDDRCFLYGCARTLDWQIFPWGKCHGVETIKPRDLAFVGTVPAGS